MMYALDSTYEAAASGMSRNQLIVENTRLRREARRSDRSFEFASVIAALMFLVAVVGWLR